MTLVLPGSAQLVAGNKRVGRLALRVWATLLALAVLLALVGYLWNGLVFRIGSSVSALGMVQMLLLVVAVGWAGLFVDAWRLGQPLTLPQNQRLAMVGVNGVLCFSVAGTLLFGAHMVSVHRDLVATMFGDGSVTSANDGRYNVLLMGGDSGDGRWGLRPDSLTVASIDAETGRTVLFGLPRNLANFPFREGSVMDEQFPDGFNCEGCYLNGVSTWAGDNVDLFGGSQTPGIDATVSAVEGITGLEINYWALANLQGFKDLVDAVGGVTLDVRDRIPVGLPHEAHFHYIEPGRKLLNGHDTLWFARARQGSDDYSRMARQKCVMNAMVGQISPQKVVRNYEKLARAGSAMISTNLPAGELDRFMGLALKARGQKLATVSFVPPMVNTGNPDIDLIHGRVEAAIDRAEGKAPASSAQKKEPATSGGSAGAGQPAPGAMTGGSLGSLKEGYAANDTEDLGASC
ncbi:LCP family protein [Nocardioides sp.]|uniref:LCP family protein n=1 Tax=Nocardioides sp. TaxID=35761 RepID=UPI0027343D67|nr:LCP family protein [Nocardioides sp.]MDP3894815.1 LCP family protein [Nocardioides sp.]